MSPLYDIRSVWPYLESGPNQLSRHKAAMAMAVRSKNAHYIFREIHARHWHQLAMKNGGPKVWEAMLLLVGKVDAALSTVEMLLPNDFPQRTWTTISAGMRAEVKRFLSEPAN